MAAVTRNFVKLLWWIGVAGAAVLVTLGVGISNYLGIKNALELAGYEMRPVHTDELIGASFGAFIPDATMAHFYALTLTCVMALAFFLTFHIGSEIYKLSRDRLAYVTAGDHSSARIARHLMISKAVWMLAFAVLAGTMAKTDLLLFRFRSVAGALGLDEPSAVATRIKAWPLELQENGGLAVWDLAKSGGTAYIAFTVAACLALEYSFVSIAEAWDKLVAAVGQLFRGDSGELAADEVREDQLEPAVAADTDSERSSPPLFTPVEPTAVHGLEVAEPTGPPPFSGIVKPSKRPAQLPSTRPATSSGNDPEMLDVVGSDGEQVLLADATAATDRYFVDTNGQVWSRPFWDQLHGTTPDEQISGS